MICACLPASSNSTDRVPTSDIFSLPSSFSISFTVLIHSFRSSSRLGYCTDLASPRTPDDSRAFAVFPPLHGHLRNSSLRIMRCDIYPSSPSVWLDLELMLPSCVLAHGGTPPLEIDKSQDCGMTLADTHLLEGSNPLRPVCEPSV